MCVVNARCTTAFGRSIKGFYALAALVALMVAVLGFAPTYFVPLATGSFAAPPIVHIHAAFFFSWTLFFCSQTWLIYTGRTLSHRAWGMAGISLATAMVFSVFIAAGAMIHLRSNAGYAEQALAFSWVQIGGMLFFAGAFGAAIANVNAPDVHKRLMLLATVSLLDAPIARWVMILTAPAMPPGVPPPPPVEAVLIPAMIAGLLLVAAMAFDWRTTRSTASGLSDRRRGAACLPDHPPVCQRDACMARGR